MNLKTIERKILRAVQQDGLTLIFSGISLAGMALFFYDHRLAWVTGPATWIWPVLLPSLRNRITLPRIGYFRFPKAKLLKNALVIAVVLILALLGGRALDYSALHWLAPVYWAVVLGATAFVLATRYAYAPYYGVAALCLLSGVGGMVLVRRAFSDDAACAIQFSVLAAVLIPWGLVRLLRFLRDNPPEPWEEALGGQL